MECKDVRFGTYECAYNIMTPWRSDDGEAHMICVDKCLLPEILRLWELGIRTTGCCCGHGDESMAFISVREDFIPKMKSLGYKVWRNKCRPKAEDSFTPLLTCLNYGSADKGFNWWDEQVSEGYINASQVRNK